MSSIRYEFIMSQVKIIRDIKETEKVKISLIFYEGCQGTCVLKVCKDRDLTEVYQSLMGVRHPNLAIVYDCVYENGNTYVIEEYIHGKTIAEILAVQGTFTEEETIRIMKDVCDGLEVLHQKEPSVIHNDIKAANIMMREDKSIKLFDFDISRIYKDDSCKNTRLMGTHEYAAPEHYGFEQSEPCTDIYSLGVTMHEMLAGTGLNREHQVTYDGPLSGIIKKCVEIDRKRRYASAALLKADLEKMQKKLSPIWKIVTAVLCAVLLLVAGSFCLSGAWEDEKTPQGNPGTEGEILEGETSTGDSEDVEGESEFVGETESDETKEDDSQEDGSQESSGEGNSEVVETPPSETPNNPSSDTPSSTPDTSKKSVKTVYTIQDTFLAMDAWNDGTFLMMEEISGKYYLRSSDGKEKEIENLDVTYGAQLERNPYTDQMYLIVLGYYDEFVYSVSRDLEIELITKCITQTEAYVGFFSDGTLLHISECRNSTDWSLVYQYKNMIYPKVIKDKLYSFESITNNYMTEYFFFERDEDWNIVRRFSLKDEGIGFSPYAYEGSVYCDSLAVYFIGQKSPGQYLYCFDGEQIVPIICLTDYTGGINSSYRGVCVTDKAMRCYDETDEIIVEFEIE